MATSGSVTITAKVNAEDAERKLQAIARAEREVGAEVARSNSIQAQSAKAASEHYDKLSASQREFSQRSRVAAGDVVQLSANLSVLGLAALEAKEHLGLIGTGVKAMGLLRGPVGIIASLGALTLAAKAASDSMEYLGEVAIPAAGRAEASLASLRIVTERTGGDVEATTEHVEDLENALTGLTAASEATRTFNTMGLSLERQTQLIDAMRDGIVAMNGDVNTQLPLMALAIKRQEGELLDNMGVVSTVEMMYQEYAKTIGTTSDKLTQHQREEAVIQGVLRETAKYTGAAATAMKTYEGRVAALATEKQKLAKDIGDLFLPLSTFTVAVETLGVKLQRRLLDPLKEVRGYLGQSFNETAVLLGGGTLPNQSTDDATVKTIKKLQAINTAERARQAQAAKEGGYGPANDADLGTFYEERAKRVQAANERAEREAKQHAEQVASLNQQLRDRLNELTMERFDFARYHAQRAHDDEVRRGADRVLAAKVLSEKLKAIAKDEAEARSRYFTEMWGNDTKRLTDQAKRIGASNVMGPFLPGQEQAVAAVGDDTDEARRMRKIESEIGQYVEDFNKAADEAADKQKRALEEGGEKVRDAIGQAMLSGAGVMADSIRTGQAPSAGSMLRAGAGIASAFGPWGIATGVGATLLGGWFDGQDDAKKREAEEKAADAAERFASRMEDATSSLDEFWRKIDQGTKDFETWEGKKGGAEDAFTRFMVESGKWTDEDVQRRALGRSLDWMVGDSKGNIGFDASKLTVEQLTKIDPALLDPNNREVGSISRALGVSGDIAGQFTDDKLLEAIRIAFGLKAAQLEDDKRVGPDGSTEKPFHTIIMNVKDFREAFAEGTYFRNQMSSGTTRGNGPGRGINTGKAV